MLATLRYLNEIRKSRGLAGVLAFLNDSLLKINNFLVFYLDLRKPFTANAAPTGLVMHCASVAELEQLRSGRDDLPYEFYCDQSFGFTLPFLATYEGKLAAIHWLVLPGEYSRFMNLHLGDVELNYNTVLPEFRGKRIAQALMAFVVGYSVEAGYHRMFGVVLVSNIAQFKPMLDLGFRPVENLVHFALRRPKATLQYLDQR
jgi:ribosomal protein S18 acetylase RimI-like enzyme